MKAISIEQLKNRLANTNTIIEESLQLDPSSIEDSKRNLKEIVASLESLNDALFFKLEKLRSKIQGYNTDRYTDAEKQINKFMKSIQIPPLDDSIVLLEENRNIIELKTIQKYLKYYTEIQKNPENVLSSLLHSALDEDYRFLSELLYYGIKYGDPDTKNVYFEYGKKLESKMMEQFQFGIDVDDLKNCKTAFEILKNIFKETVLIDGYIQGMAFMESQKYAEPSLVTQINLDTFVLENSEFQKCIETTISVLEPSLPKYIAIFDGSPSYRCYLYRKIYENHISKNISNFLDITDSAVFLMSIVDVYNNLQRYKAFLERCSPKMALNEYSTEGIDTYIPIAITKEKHLFEEIFGILCYGTETVNTYTILGEKVKLTTDYVSIYKKLLCVIYGMESRCESVYRTTSTDEHIVYFYKKMKLLIEKTAVGDPMQIIERLTKMYLLTRRYFGNRIAVVKEWIVMLDTRIKEAYESKINAVNTMMQSKIGNMYFTSKNSHKTVYELLKRCVDEGSVLGGRNYELYVHRVVCSAYDGIYKQVLGIVYSKDQRENLMDGINDFLGYVTILNSVDLVRKFAHLREIGMLITVEPLLFKETYEVFQGSINESKLNAILKCRKDRENIKEIMGKK